MTEIPKLPQDGTLNDPATLKDILHEFVGETRIPAQIEADEVSRKKATDIVDAERGLKDALEVRRDVIEREQAGEGISPEVAKETGEIVIAAAMHVHELAHQDKLPFDNPSG